MANIYYKNNQNVYKQLTYNNIDAAAKNHTHLMSDIGMLNFQNNGCTGQNILNNLNATYPNMLFYVPNVDSNMIYAKRMPASVLSHATVPWCNINQAVSYTITPTSTINANAATALNNSITTFYEYKDTYPIITNEDILYHATEKYYCYYYPLQIKCLTTNVVNPQILLTFKTNLDNNIDSTNSGQIDEEKTYNYEIAFKPIINNSIITGYQITSFSVPSHVNLIALGLIQNYKDSIKGICFVLNEQIKQQIDISDLKIASNINLSINQFYHDYYDISSMPPIEVSGSLGAITQSGYDYTNESIARYYRSYKFYNLLTYGQEVIITQCIIPGYCSSNFKKGKFMLYWPYEIDPIVLQNTHNTSSNSYNDILTLEAIWSKITEDNEEAYSKYTEIWALNRVIVNSNNGMPLVADNTETNIANQISYNIIDVQPGRLIIDMYFPTAATTGVTKYCPLQFLAEGGLKITVISN